MERGYYFAIVAAVLWGLIDAIGRFVVSSLNVNPLLFTSFAFVFGGAALLAVAGVGRTGIDTLKHGNTWAYGAMRVVQLMAFNTGMIMLTATEGSFINRIGVLISVALSAFILGKKPQKADMFGLFIVFAGCVMLINRQDGGIMNWGVWAILVCALLNALLAFMVQIHPVSNRSLGTRARCRYTGVVMAVSSLFFVGLAFAAAAIAKFIPESVVGELLAQVLIIPTIDDFYNTNLYISALFMGVLLYSSVNYVTFYAIRVINAENTLMAGALIPFAALGFESLLSVFGLVDISSIDGYDIMLGGVITFGALLTFVVRFIRHRKTSAEIE